MKKNKLLILLIVLTLIFVNSGIVSAATALRPAPQPPSLSLKVSMSPITIYPPLVLFTAKLSPLPPSADAAPVVEYFLVTPTLCLSPVSSSATLCDPRLDYLGSVRVNQYGEAVFSKQMMPGAYTAIARVKIDGATIWSNNVSFKIP